MIGFKGFNFNILNIANRKICMNDDIISIDIKGNKIFVVVSADNAKENTKEYLNNVYCYDNEGNLMWQIQQEENVKYKRFPFGGIGYDKYEEIKKYHESYPLRKYMEKNKIDKLLIAVDEAGGTFEIDEQTGKVLNFFGRQRF